MSTAKKVIGGCQILEKLGQGGMGSVYKAKQISMDRIVAMKILDPIIAKDTEKRERFLKEAKASAKLHHPNIISIHSAGYDNGYVYYTMEYIEGGSVADLLKKKGELEESQVIKIAMQICKGLSHANQSNIIHRDVKPDNFMVTLNGTIKLCDLGLAKILDDDAYKTQEGTFLGTPYYTSPEQVKGLSNIDTRADLYSLGATMYHLASGEPPFKGASALSILTMHLNDEPRELKELNNKLSKKFCDVVMTLMEKDPEDRYQTPDELYEELEDLSLSGQGGRKRGHARITQKMAAVVDDEGSLLKPILFVVVPLVVVITGLFLWGDRGGNAPESTEIEEVGKQELTGLASAFAQDKSDVLDSAKKNAPKEVFALMHQVADIYSQALPAEVEVLNKEVSGILQNRAKEYFAKLLESEKDKSLKAIEASEYYEGFLGIQSLLESDKDEWQKAMNAKSDLENRRKELLELVVVRLNKSLLPIDGALKIQNAQKILKLKQDDYPFINDFYVKLSLAVSVYLQDAKAKENAYVESRKEPRKREPQPVQEVKTEGSHAEQVKTISGFLKSSLDSKDVNALLSNFRKNLSDLNKNDGVKTLLEKEYPGLIESLTLCDGFYKQVHRDLKNIYLGEKIEIDKTPCKIVNVEEFEIVVMDPKRQTRKISIDQLPEEFLFQVIGKSRSYNSDICYGAGVFSKIKGNDTESQTFFDTAIKGKEQYKNLAEQFNKSLLGLQ